MTDYKGDMDLPAGRTERFASLYAAHYAAVHAYGSRRVGHEAADEIAAETFLVAWRRFDQLPAEALPWLYGVARNVVRRHRMKTGRQLQTLEALQREPSTAGDNGGDYDSRLWTAWAELRDGDREVLALIAWEELSVAEAARVIGCAAPVFSVRLHRARRRLERLLSADAAHPDSSHTLAEA
jgi:RNA polymerase sigma-70 factor (ECF subfamily)